jgi:hypothetical protein
MVLAMHTILRLPLVAFLLLKGGILTNASAQDVIRPSEIPLASSAPLQFPGGVMPASFAQATDYMVSATPAAPGAVEVPCQNCDQGCFDFNLCCTPGIYAQADGLFWHRIGTGCNQVLVLNTTTGDPLLSAGDLDFNLSGGPRFLIGWQPDPCHCSRCCAWELSYFGIFDWTADAVVTGPGNLAIPGDLGLASNNFLLADRISALYHSEMHNVELNCIKSCCLDDCTRIDFLAGVRYISVDEDYILSATDFTEGTSAYEVNADNDLFGVQLGGRLRRAWCRWAVELTGKAGIFYNDVQTSQLIRDFPNNFVLRDTTASTDGPAMLGELGVILIRPINDNWNFRVGYNLLGLGGVALAPNQLDFSLAGVANIDKDGWFLAHGGLIGVETRW